MIRSLSTTAFENKTNFSVFSHEGDWIAGSRRKKIMGSAGI